VNIGEASKATGVSVKMLRYYEEIRLVRPALRTTSGYRVYSEKDISMLRFVRRARDLGFQVKQIAALLDLWQDGSRASADVKSLAQDHVRELMQRRRELDQADEPEVEGIARQVVDLPADGHGDDLRGEGGQEPRQPVAQERPVPERRIAFYGR